MLKIKDNSSQTMRIDIHPDFLGESLAEKKQASYAARRATDRLSVQEKAADIASQSSTYQKLLQSVYDAVLITDSRGRIVDFNSRALDFFLCDKSEFSGTNIIDLISGSDDSLLASIRKNLTDHRFTLIEAHCIRWDKSMFPAEIAVNNINIDDEEQLSFFIRDVTIRKRAQEALEEAVARLEEHDNARLQFISNVSHELRTPLTSMTYAVANILRGVAGPISDRLRRYIELIQGDCKRMLGTVNDILDLRKIDDGTLTLAKARIPFARLLQRGADSFRVQVEQKSLKIAVNADNAQWFVDCDVHKIERVIMNLVGNAVKFTPEGGAIDLSLRNDPQRPGYVLLSVQDTGIGIRADAIDRVTERYFTVGEQACGSGLGLAISKEIIEIHQGAIRIMSPPPGAEKGTVVYVSLPLAEAPTVLVVEDDKDVQSVLAQQMLFHGYKVMTAEGGLDALDKINYKKPDVVILDMVLPEMDGTDVILKMKSEQGTMRIPIIVLTGAHVGGAKAQILNNFSIPAVAKPWSESDLLDRIEGALLGVAVLGR